MKSSHFSRLHIRAVLVITLALTGIHPAHAREPLPALPEGDEGLAAKYPGDAGIAGDPAVILADDFESHATDADLGRVWNNVYNQTSLTSEVNHVYRGNQALEFRVPARTVMASGAARYLDEEYDVVFFRYHSMFDTTYDVMGSAHNGGGISAKMYKKGRSSAGEKADGKNKFYATIDHGRMQGFPPVANPGFMGIYIYHPGQRHRWGDCFFPTGDVIPYSSTPGDFGPDFVSRPNIVTKLGTWHCHELMVQANTPGQKDGRIAVWVDGKIAMDFPNLRLRDIASLKIDQINIGLFIGPGKHPATRKWYDNVVVATSYIGPVHEP